MGEVAILKANIYLARNNKKSVCGKFLFISKV